MAPYKKLVQRFFTREERKNLLKLSKDDLRKAFFQIWTAKEAVLKAMGTGLSFELDRLDTTKTLHQQTSEVVILNKDDTETRYIVYRIDPGSDYTAALAIINRDINIRYFQTPEHIR